MAMTTANIVANTSPNHPFKASDLSVFPVRLTGDSSYATGGTDLSPLFATANVVNISVSENGNTTRTYRWDKTNNKLLAFTWATGAQVAAATDLSADTISLEVSMLGPGS